MGTSVHLKSFRTPSRIGILLINLGTPDEPTSRAVRRYLAEFLSDRRVIEIPGWIWQPVLHSLILTRRPAKVAHAYRQIWDRGSPLATNTREQAAALSHALGSHMVVDYAMRYGNPAIGERIASLIARGCDRVLLAPLYPQYSAATTGTALDKAFETFGTMRTVPAVRTLPPYFDQGSYIEALRASVDEGLAQLDFIPDAIVTSYHGMPERTLALGDPYRRQCEATNALLAKALGRELTIAFQSQFGSAKWFTPATDDLLSRMPREGKRGVVVLTPGFSADCIETLEEIDVRARGTFLAAGGERFAYIPCLNATRAGVAMLLDLVNRELQGW